MNMPLSALPRVDRFPGDPAQAAYGLGRPAFAPGFDPAFVYRAPSAQAAADAVAGFLAAAARGAGGVFCLWGAAGIGKSTLIEAALRGGPEGLRTGRGAAGGASEAGFAGWLDAAIAGPGPDGRPVLLVFDTAERLGEASLSTLLARATAPGGPAALLAAAPHPRLAAALGAGAAARLGPLAAEESAAFLDHRIVAAGGAPGVFTPEAAAALHALSGGVPRELCRLAQATLFLGAAAGHRRIDADAVARAQGRTGPKPRAGAPILSAVAAPVAILPVAMAASPVAAPPAMGDGSDLAAVLRGVTRTPATAAARVGESAAGSSGATPRTPAAVDPQAAAEATLLRFATAVKPAVLPPGLPRNRLRPPPRPAAERPVGLRLRHGLAALALLSGGAMLGYLASTGAARWSAPEQVTAAAAPARVAATLPSPAPTDPIATNPPPPAPMQPAPVVAAIAPQGVTAPIATIPSTAFAAPQPQPQPVRMPGTAQSAPVVAATAFRGSDGRGDTAPRMVTSAAPAPATVPAPAGPVAPATGAEAGPVALATAPSRMVPDQPVRVQDVDAATSAPSRGASPGPVTLAEPRAPDRITTTGIGWLPGPSALRQAPPAASRVRPRAPVARDVVEPTVVAPAAPVKPPAVTTWARFTPVGIPALAQTGYALPPTDVFAAPRIVLHYTEGDVGAAEILAAALLARGQPNIELRAVSFAVSTTQLRFFHAADRAAAEAVAAALPGATDPAALLRDFTTYERLPSPGSLEIWLRS